MGIFRKMRYVGVDLENSCIRRNLFVAKNFCHSSVEPALLSLLIANRAKMRGKISTPSAETCTTTPFAFGSGLKIRERVDRLRSRDFTNNMVRNVGFDALERIPICTFC